MQTIHKKSAAQAEHRSKY